MSICLSMLCFLGFITLALLIMVRAVTLEDALKGFGKAFAFIVVAFFALCLFTVTVPTLMAELKRTVAWLMKIALIVGGITVVAGVAWNLAVRPTRRTNTEEL